MNVNLLERVMGIEPTCSAWKADVLPLNYTRQILHHPFAINIQLTDLLRNILFHRVWHFKKSPAR